MNLQVPPAVALPRVRKTFVYREKSEHTGELYAALAKAQGEFLPIERETEADWGMFASLRSMQRSTLAALSRNQLAVSQEYAITDTGLCVVTTLGHGLSGEWISSVLPIRQTGDVHEDAAYMTTMRRMGYAGILCLAPEDEKAAEKKLENADAKAAAQAWVEQKRLAKDALVNAKTVARVDDVLSKIKAKVDAGDMDPHDLPSLEELAINRVKELQQAEAKPKSKREEVTA